MTQQPDKSVVTDFVFNWTVGQIREKGMQETASCTPNLKHDTQLMNNSQPGKYAGLQAVSDLLARVVTRIDAQHGEVNAANHRPAESVESDVKPRPRSRRPAARN
jgi:hypothetical protein